MSWTDGSPAPSILYGHISDLAAGVHDGLLGWIRGRLREAGQETVEVYGQFPPAGTTSRHVVLFPFQVVPDVKLVETGNPGALLGNLRAEPPPHVPQTMVALGRRLTESLTVLFGDRLATPAPRPLSSLPPALAAWYAERADSPWVDPNGGAPTGRLPAMMWRLGVPIAIRYLAIAGEPGRGVTERTTAAAPVSIRVLSVIAAAIHLERVFMAPLPAQPMPPELVSYVEAVIDALSDEQRRPLQAALAATRLAITAPIAIHPLGEMSDQLLTQLMQALQRPLQAMLAMQVRVMIAAFPSFEPANSMTTSTRPATR